MTTEAILQAAVDACNAQVAISSELANRLTIDNVSLDGRIGNLETTLPTKADVGHNHDGEYLSSVTATSDNVANSLVERDANGDFKVRTIQHYLTASNAGFSDNISDPALGLAFRVNNTDNAALRFVTDAAEVRQWLGVPQAAHGHAASDITSGTLAVARLPIGTSSSHVAAADHDHVNMAHITDGTFDKQLKLWRKSGALGYFLNSDEWGLDANDSDIIGVNGLYFADESNNSSEGLMWPRSGHDGSSNGGKDKWSSLRAYDDELIFHPNANLGGKQVMHAGLEGQSYYSAVNINTMVQAKTGRSIDETVDGTWTFTQDVTSQGSFNALSDIRLKDNLEEITDALGVLKELTSYTYDRIDKPEDGRFAGLIAQDVQSAFPLAVSENEAGILSIKQDGIIALLVQSVNEIVTQIADIAVAPIINQHTHPELERAVLGNIQNLPHRPENLPKGWYFCNGENWPIAAPQGAALCKLHHQLREDWGIVRDDDAGQVNVPNLFDENGKGLIFAPADSIDRMPGEKVAVPIGASGEGAVNRYSVGVTPAIYLGV